MDRHAFLRQTDYFLLIQKAVSFNSGGQTTAAAADAGAPLVSNPWRKDYREMRALSGTGKKQILTRLDNSAVLS
jgi:hypothetical protein